MTKDFDDSQYERAPLPDGKDFADERFALNNKALFDEFIELTVRGVDIASALRLTFGECMLADSEAHGRVWGIQRNPYYKKQFALRLKAIPTNEMWNPKLAVHNLVKLALDPSAKDSARINAMKELNVITGITIVDENGQTKIGRSMDDFYTAMERQADLHYPPAKPESKPH